MKNDIDDMSLHQLLGYKIRKMALDVIRHISLDISHDPPIHYVYKLVALQHFTST